MRVLGVVLLPDPGLAARQECRRTMAKQESLRVTAHGAGSSTSRPSASRSVQQQLRLLSRIPDTIHEVITARISRLMAAARHQIERRRCPLIHEGASASLRRPGERAARLDRAGDRAASRRPTPRGLRGPGPSLRATAPEARGAVPVWSPTLRVGSSPIPRASGSSWVPCRPVGPCATLLRLVRLVSRGWGEGTERRGAPGRSAARSSG